jgi:hypothetical protein
MVSTLVRLRVMEKDPPTLLCTFCRDHFNELSPWARGNFDIQQTRSIASLKTSLAQGCQLCCLTLLPTNAEFLGDDHLTFELAYSDRFPGVLELRFRPSSANGALNLRNYRSIDLIKLDSMSQ